MADATFLEFFSHTLVFSHTKREFWACFHENWVYNFGHCCRKVWERGGGADWVTALTHFRCDRGRPPKRKIRRGIIELNFLKLQKMVLQSWTWKQFAKLNNLFTLYVLYFYCWAGGNETTISGILCKCRLCHRVEIHVCCVAATWIATTTTSTTMKPASIRSTTGSLLVNITVTQLPVLDQYLLIKKNICTLSPIKYIAWRLASCKFFSGT